MLEQQTKLSVIFRLPFVKSGLKCNRPGLKYITLHSIMYKVDHGLLFSLIPCIPFLTRHVQRFEWCDYITGGCV